VSGGIEYTVDDAGVYASPLVLSYPYARTLGPTLSRFFTALRDGRIEGARAPGGPVLVPPPDYDPHTGQPVSEFVEVGPEGTVTTWTWVAEPLAGQPSSEPFAWALIALDGADAAMLHAVLGPRDRIGTGARVRAVWASERTGTLADLAGFEVIG
jgi:uncharacterized OB-fold protein